MHRSSKKSDQVRPTTQNFIQDENGSYLLETALVMPAFLTIVFLFITSALGFFVWENATFAARSAMRFAIVRSNSSNTPCTVSQIQQAVSSTMLTAAGGTVTTVANWSQGNSIGSTLQVTVTVIYPVMLPFLSSNSWTLTSTSTGTVIN